MGVPGGGGGASPPSLLGKQSLSGNICSTVGQYWLIIKKNGTNSVNFLGNCVNFVGNLVTSGKFVMYRKLLVCPINFWTPKTVHRPKFFWRRGGGEVVKINYLRKKIFTTCRAKSEKVGQICFRPPNFFLPVRPWFCHKALIVQFVKNTYGWV